VRSRRRNRRARRDFLNEAQQRVIEETLNSTDRVHGLQGRAGTGKTTVVQSIREGAEKSGYTVEGFAPTSRAAAQLREAGIDASTLQSFLARGENHPSAKPELRHLYMLDESSLASTRQMRAFLEKLKPQDRVLVIGDTSQHQAVDAGRPFEQMQQAGMRTSQLDQIMRQKDPELRRAVELLANNETEKGVALLSEQGRVTEIAGANERIAAIAKIMRRSPKTPSSSRPTIAAAARSTKPCAPSCGRMERLAEPMGTSCACSIIAPI
jgi:ATP-dependent exoDNAse (exonuclease V) alpha subunit